MISTAAAAPTTRRCSAHASDEGVPQASTSRSHMTATVKAGVADLQQQFREKSSHGPHRLYYGQSGSQRSSGPAVTHAASVRGNNAGGQLSSFLSRSASVNHNAAERSRKQAAEKGIVYKRNVNATFDEVSEKNGQGRSDARPAGAICGEQVQRSAAIGTTEGSIRRDEALRLAESLQVGPCTTSPPDDDLHFSKLEPNSGIPLRRRILPHLELQAHLDGRYVLPISKLYSIAVHKSSPDGDVTIPIDGDWLIFGVLVEVSEVITGKAAYLDHDGTQRTPKDAEELEERRKEGLRIFEASQWRTFTLLDLSRELDKSGEHNGSDQVNLTLYSAERVWRENGTYKYSGGSAGGFETLSDHDLGTVVCVMNATIRNYKDKSQSRRSQLQGGALPDMRDETSSSGEKKLLTLVPRGKDTLLKIGTARDYKQCEAFRSDGKRCRNFVDVRSGDQACSFHVALSIRRIRNGRQEFASGTAKLLKSRSQGLQSDYAFSDGMSLGPASKAFITNTSLPASAFSSSTRGSAHYDVSHNYGRDAGQSKKRKEERASDALLRKKLRTRHDLQPWSRKHTEPGNAASDTYDKVTVCQEAYSTKGTPSCSREEANTCSNKRPKRQSLASIEDSLRASQCPISSAARLALQQLQAASVGRTRRLPHSRKTVTSSADPASAQSVSQSQRNARSQDLLMSSKLLARHSTSSALLPTPILSQSKRGTSKVGDKTSASKSSVRPPPGASFYPSDDSDEEFDAIVSAAHFDDTAVASAARKHPSRLAQARPVASDKSDSGSDIEIVGM